MILMDEIPDWFWSLSHSINRSTYVEALLKISEEYEYSNYLLSREMYIQPLSEYFSRKRYVLWQDETGDNWDAPEPPATRVLNWPLGNGWLGKADDYANMTVNIVIPDYVAVMIEAFARLTGDGEDETKIYIQNVYAIPFSLENDPRFSITSLNTVPVSIKKLNRSLQDTLHNMDKFFGSLLEQKNYESLFKEHLNRYVEEIVNRKYYILKASDNFYLYKTDIKCWITVMRQDEKQTGQMYARPAGSFVRKPSNATEAEAMEKLDQLERGFNDIEHRIANMDKEHTRYVRATITRFNYPLNQEDNMKELVVQLLNHLPEYDCPREDVSPIGAGMNLSQVSILSERSLYKRRRTKTDFKEQLKDEALSRELSMEEVLNLNKVKNHYSRKEIGGFIETHTENRIMAVDKDTVSNDEESEKLVLVYDYFTCLKSVYKVEDREPEMIHNGRYIHPGSVFARRKK